MSDEKPGPPEIPKPRFQPGPPRRPANTRKPLPRHIVKQILAANSESMQAGAAVVGGDGGAAAGHEAGTGQGAFAPPERRTWERAAKAATKDKD